MANWSREHKGEKYTPNSALQAALDTARSEPEQFHNHIADDLLYFLAANAAKLDPQIIRKLRLEIHKQNSGLITESQYETLDPFMAELTQGK